MKLVNVKWVDSFGVTSSWEDIDDIDISEMVVKSVGYVVKESDDCIAIAANITMGDHTVCRPQACGVMTIPIVTIVEMKEMESV